MRVTRINSLVPEIKSENIVECVAGEDIPAGAVIIKKNDDLAYCADIYNESHAHRTFGISTQMTYIGEVVKAQVVNSFKMPSWNWEFRKPVYCGDYGIPTQTRPESGFIQIVGIPYKKDMLYVDIEPAILSDDYKVEISLEQEKYRANAYEYVEFKCLNAGYEIIEWKVNGKNYGIKESEISGTNLIGENISSIRARWPKAGNYSVKARLKDINTHLWSAWSNPLRIEIL